MGITLNATAVAALPALTTPPFPKDVLAGSDTPDVSKNVASGDTDWPQKYNCNGAMVDVLARAMGRGIVTGLGLSATGLALTVANGMAIIDGIVDVKSLATYTLPASVARCWLWLKQDGTVAHTTTTTAPAYNAVLLGSCETDGSGVVGSFDTSGVVYIISGVRWRETADAGAPGDTLSANERMYTKTAGGTYFWTGTAHQKFN